MSHSLRRRLEKLEQLSQADPPNPYEKMSDEELLAIAYEVKVDSEAHPEKYRDDSGQELLKEIGKICRD